MKQKNDNFVWNPLRTNVDMLHKEADSIIRQISLRNAHYEFSIHFKKITLFSFTKKNLYSVLQKPTNHSRWMAFNNPNLAVVLQCNGQNKDVSGG